MEYAMRICRVNYDAMESSEIDAWNSLVASIETEPEDDDVDARFEDTPESGQ